MLSWRDHINQDGYAILPNVVSEGATARLIAALGGVPPGEGIRRRGSLYAIRNLLDVPAVRELADSPAIRALVAPILGPECFPARGLLFDKTPRANWKVSWHQDLSIAVEARREVAGFGPCSCKAG